MREVRFEVFIQTPQETRLRFYGSDGRMAGDRLLPKEEVDRFVAEIESGYRAATPNLSSLGQRLYSWLDGPTERWLATASKGTPGGLAVHIDVAGRLRHLPWELLCENGLFLCTRQITPLTPVRRVPAAKQEIPVANRPLHLLFMACSAEGVEPVLAFEHEEAMILEATRRHSIVLDVEESGSLEGLADRIRDVDPGYFDVFHLSGHAGIDNGEPCFVMETDTGSPRLATVDEIARAFAGSWPTLVFLSGCETGQAVDQGALPSFCERLVAAGAPVVLGWALPVGDQAASRAAQELYRNLTAGWRIDESVAHARAALSQAASPYWHLLRLYSGSTSLANLVTRRLTPERAQVHVREAQQEFLDAGSKSEVCPRAKFVGRRRAIQRCLKILRSVEGDEIYHEGILLHGLGGIGKSSLAARLSERMLLHRRMVWVGRVDEIRFLHVLGDRLEDPSAVALLEDTRYTLRQRLRLLLKGPQSTQPLLFVFDDFEQNVEWQKERIPRLDDRGLAILEPAALRVLSDLLAAIRDTCSASRVLVACRYQLALPGPARLYAEELETLRGADLEKKVFGLAALAPGSETDQKLRDQAVALAAGNPRLLERLNDLLSSDQIDFRVHPATILDKTFKEFGEEILLRELLDLQSPETRNLLALMAIFSLPVDRAAVEAVAGGLSIDRLLPPALALGLVECMLDQSRDVKTYYISPLLHPFLEIQLSQEQRMAACRKAASHLRKSWLRNERYQKNEDHLIEIHKLALAAGDKAMLMDAEGKLNHLVAFRNIVRLENRKAPEWLRIVLEHQLTESQPMQPAPKRLNLRKGEEIVVRILNNSPKRLHFVVLDCAPDYSVTQIFPARSSLPLPLDPGEGEVFKIRAWLPPGLDDVVDVLKVFATEQAVNFRWLELPPLDRSTRGNQWRSRPQNSLEVYFAGMTSKYQTKTRSDLSEQELVSIQMEIRVRR